MVGIFNIEDFITAISDLIKIRKMKVPPYTKHGVIKDIRIPPKIRIGDCYEVSAVYEGRLKSGYFSLMIQDRDGIKQWFRDKSNVGHIFLDSGKSNQTGALNFSNGRYESKWKFRPCPPLYAGWAKAVICMFGDTKSVPLDLQEKDIQLI